MVRHLVHIGRRPSVSSRARIDASRGPPPRRPGVVSPRLRCVAHWRLLQCPRWGSHRPTASPAPSLHPRHRFTRAIASPAKRNRAMKGDLDMVADLGGATQPSRLARLVEHGRYRDRLPVDIKSNKQASIGHGPSRLRVRGSAPTRRNPRLGQTTRLDTSGRIASGRSWTNIWPRTRMPAAAQRIPRPAGRTRRRPRNMPSPLPVAGRPRAGAKDSRQRPPARHP